MNTATETFDVVVVGAGPAGLMAAMQAKRQGLTVALFERDRPGGQALAANWIENFPGIPEGIRGMDLMQRFVDQVKAHGVEIRREKVMNISLPPHPDPLPQGERGHTLESFLIKTDKSEIKSTAVIIAVGMIPKRLDIPGENELWGKHIFAYDDPNEIDCRGKQIVVIGSGDAAFDQALNFSRLANEVTIAMRSTKASCAPILLERVKKAKIRILEGHDAESVAQDKSGLLIEFKNGEKLAADIVIECIGKERNFKFIDPDLLDKKVPGMFFAGDCHRNLDRHISIACGDGTAAAMEAHDYIIKLRAKN